MNVYLNIILKYLRCYLWGFSPGCCFISLKPINNLLSYFVIMLFLPRSVKIISELQRAHIASDNVWRIKRDVRHAKYNIIYGNKPDDAGNLCDYILGDTYKTHFGVSANQLTLLRSFLSRSISLLHFQLYSSIQHNYAIFPHFLFVYFVWASDFCCSARYCLAACHFLFVRTAVRTVCPLVCMWVSLFWSSFVVCKLNCILCSHWKARVLAIIVPIKSKLAVYSGGFYSKKRIESESNKGGVPMVPS